MEPVTHMLTGACIGRAGLNRKTAYATLAGLLAAEAPDLDRLWSFHGSVDELKCHRGITHTFIGAPVVAGVVVGVVALYHFWRERQKKRTLETLIQKGKAPTATGAPIPLRFQPKIIHWGWLYLTALIAALSHILLDWTNTYGVRPFYPLNPRWYAGGLVFIVDPIMWTLLILAFVAPWILGLADSEIGVRRQPFRGRGWAIFALVGMVLWWSLRYAEHVHAQALVENMQIAAVPVKRVAVEPYALNPFRWHAILETADYYQTAEVDTRTGQVDSDPHRDLLYKPASTPATEAAKQTNLGKAYLSWSSWPVVRDLGPVPVPGMDPPRLGPNRVWTTVGFNDLRFDYSLTGARTAPANSHLGGAVYIVDNRDDAGESLNGKEQK